MKKYLYKVKKGFTIMKGEDGKEIISDDTDEKGSSFTKNSDYIDYEFPQKGIKKSPLTKRLNDEGYIELLEETDKI